MPINAQDRRAKRLSDLLGKIPILLSLEVANGNNMSTASHGKFIAIWRPFDTGCSPVDPEQDQLWFPNPFAILLPDIGLAIRATRDNALRHFVTHTRRPVDPSDALRVRADFGGAARLLHRVRCGVQSQKGRQ